MHKPIQRSILTKKVAYSSDWVWLQWPKSKEKLTLWPLKRHMEKTQQVLIVRWKIIYDLFDELVLVIQDIN